MSKTLSANNTAPGVDARAVTPNDTTALVGGQCRALYVGGAGNLAVITAGGSSVTFTAINAGTILPVAVTHVLLTGTTATSIVAIW